MPPSLSKSDSKDKKSSCLIPSEVQKPLLLPVSEADTAQLWNQYCDISNASQRFRRSHVGPSEPINFWAGTFEPNRQINIDVLVRSKNIRVRLLDGDLAPSKMPVYLPNMAIPLELQPAELLEDINRTVSIEIFDKQGLPLGFCILKTIWKNSSPEPTLTVAFTDDLAGSNKMGSDKLERCGQCVQLQTSENATVRTHHATRVYEIMLF